MKMHKALSILFLSGSFLSTGLAQITLDLSSTDPANLDPNASQSSFTATISYSSGAFTSNQTGIDAVGSLAESPDSFSFDVTITGYSSVSFDDTNLSLSSDDTAPLLTRGNGWGVVANGGKQLLLDRKEGLLITFDNFVGITDLDFSGIGIQDSRADGGILAVDRTDNGSDYDPLVEAPYIQFGGLTTISFSESESITDVGSYVVFSTSIDAGGFRVDQISIDGVSAIPEPATQALLFALIAASGVGIMRFRSSKKAS
ncbi:MAG: hypothetical protein AAF212_00090 [Verrucomicrobiota bacterium]